MATVPLVSPKKLLNDVTCAMVSKEKPVRFCIRLNASCSIGLPKHCGTISDATEERLYSIIIPFGLIEYIGPRHC